MSQTQPRRSLQPEDLFQLSFLQGGRLSPDGEWVAYSVFSTDTQKDEDRVAIWLHSLRTGESRRLTAGLARDTSPEWSRDGTRIAFLSSRGDKPQIYVMPVDGGEAMALTAVKQGVGGGPVWSPDGKWIAFTAGPAGEPRDPKKPYRVTRDTYRFDSMGYVDDFVQSLYVIPAAGGEPKELATGDYHKNILEWSPDSREILISGMFFRDRPARAPYEPALLAADLKGGTRDILGEWGFAGAGAWTPDGQRIAFCGQPLGLKEGSNANLWVVGAHGGTPECRSTGFGYGFGGSLHSDVPCRLIASRMLVSRDGRSAYYTAQIGGAVQVYRCALTGPVICELVTAGDRNCDTLDLVGDRLLFCSATQLEPMDLYTVHTDGSSERRLTQLNEAFFSGILRPQIEHLEFPGTDGVPVEGWLMKPPMGSAPYPTVLHIHGGPHSAYGHYFYFDYHMLAGAGYAVLFINHRASTGYGEEFSTSIIGRWGDMDYKDLMAGVDLCVARGLVDPNRLGCTGNSGGGNLSCWIVGQTDRFKAAVPENPVTSFVSFYGVSDIGRWFGAREMGGLPHELPDVYTRCSPITFAHRCKTPTLLIHHEQDYRCPGEQAEQFYSILKANGCTAEMLRIPASSHGGAAIGRPEVRRAQNEALLEWMNRYVLGIASAR